MFKSVNLGAMLVLVFLALVLQTRFGESQPTQGCPSSLSNLTTCIPFVSAGAPNPNPECCAAIKAVDHTCVCSTLRIATQLPSKCNLQPIVCAPNGH